METLDGGHGFTLFFFYTGPNLEFCFTTVVLGKQKFLHFDHFFRFANTSVFLSSQFSPCISSSVTLFFYASHKALVGHYAHVNKLLTSIRPLKMAELLDFYLGFGSTKDDIRSRYIQKSISII